jgi:pimeloyl-ACP methyl ester carboxylesterase
MTAEKLGPVTDRAATPGAPASAGNAAGKVIDKLPNPEAVEIARDVIAAVARGLPDDRPPLAGLLQLEAEAERLQSHFSDGYVTWHRWGDRKAPALVLLHGGGGSWRHWACNIPALAEHYSVWIPDLPGYGESDLPANPHSYEGIIDALEAGINQLLPRDCVFDLAGFSFGSVTAGRLVRRFGRRVPRLVLVGPNFVSDMSRAVFPGLVNWRKLKDPVERMTGMFNNMRVMMILDPRHVDELALHIYTYDLGYQRLSPIAMKGRTPQTDDIPRIPPWVRLTGISGADDQVFAHVMAQQAESLDRLRPGARFHTIADASHWVMYEAPEAFNKLLLEVLAEPVEDNA